MILEFNPNANFYFVSLDFKDKGYTSFKKNITKLFLKIIVLTSLIYSLQRII